ncbi:MAG: sodium:alanine symporter family protein [Gammaproteobacteria bacterium]|nr:sodium:alanine symporter family protein [Gammaproteobacteria bacterium]MDH5175165.1 sodium:alanine symporter family protein [Gammaproteobacteria bacterium]
METFTAWMNDLNSIVWGPAMLVLILGTGFYLQLRLGGMPIRKIAAGLRLVWNGRGGDEAHGEVSPYSALMTCLAATIGVGNIAGVATAIALGGPGAVFWMWMTALVGMATKYAEVLLAVHFREKDEKGRFVGGPMYAIRNGLGPRWAWLGTMFALFGGVAGFGIGNMVQSNSIAAAMQGSFSISPVVTGVVLTVITGAVILGGIKRIAAIANWLVPFMAIGYIVTALIVLAVNAANIPHALALIFETAFTGTAAVGGFAGAAMIAAIRYGVARGIFSNEAGLGTAGIAQAAGMSNDPVRSGLIGMMGTFFDTIVVCSMTGLAIVVSGAWQSGKTGAALTQLAFQSGMPGIGDEVVAVALGIFALTTILGWAYYGERCWHFLVGDWTILPYRIIWTIMVFFGAVTHLDLAWTIADTLNALMAIPNLIALLALSPVVVQLTRAGLDRALRAD